MSNTKVLFPEPLTPVTQVKEPSGISKSTFLRLWPEAPRRTRLPMETARREGKEIRRWRERKAPVREVGMEEISPGVP